MAWLGLTGPGLALLVPSWPNSAWLGLVWPGSAQLGPLWPTWARFAPGQPFPPPSLNPLQAPQSNGTLRKLFALCLLAGVMSTALSVASLALVYSKAGGLVREMSANEGGVVNEEGVNEEGGGGGGARGHRCL